jgi:hypothetical protein
LAGRHRLRSGAGDAAGEPTIETATVARRGLRPLTVLALCCVVAVLAVLATKVAHPYGASSGGGQYTISTETSDPTGSAGAGDGTEDGTEDAPSTDGAAATAPAATDPADPTPAQPAPLPAPAANPGDPPPGPPSPTPAPSPAASATPSPVTLSYEAEAGGNTLTGTRLFSCGGCSGGRKVGYIGGGTGTLQFNGVTAASTGTAKLTIFFVNGDPGPRTCQLSVDGGASITISFPATRDWSTVGTFTLYLPLKAGAHRLRFFNNTAMGPDFDRVTLRS